MKDKNLHFKSKFNNLIFLEEKMGAKTSDRLKEEEKGGGEKMEKIRNTNLRRGNKEKWGKDWGRRGKWMAARVRLS